MLAALEWREPLWLWLLLLPPGLWLWHRLAGRRRERFADTALLPWLRRGQGAGGWRHWPLRDYAYLLAWILLVLALAGPRHAEQSRTPHSAEAPHIVALVDLSRSMDATDVRPNRRARAVVELYELLELLPQNRVGIIVFAGRAHTYVPPTTDHEALRFYLAQLEELVLPTRGSAAADAMSLALEQSAEQGGPPAAVVLLSDGDFTDAGVAAAAQAVARADSALYVLGIGGPEQVAVPVDGGGWLEHEGESVLTHLNVAGLQRLAELGGGAYQRAGADASDWQALQSEGLGRTSSQPGEEAQTLWQEHYPWLLLPGLLLLFVALMPYGLGGVASSLLLVSGLLLFAPPPAALAAEPALHTDAVAAYRSGEFAVAAEQFAQVPGYPGHMGAGASYYRLEAYPSAVAQFTQAVLLAEGDGARADALFNLGNSLFQEGDYAAAAQVFADVA
ncbi:MAG: VWA domain-containing protein, partial [Pseudomonadota bacterium]